MAITVASPIAQHVIGDATTPPRMVDVVDSLQILANNAANTNGDAFSGHLAFTGLTPTIAAGAQNGSLAPAPVLTTGSNDSAGNFTFGSGTAPTTGIQATLTFKTPWKIPGGGAPHIVISPCNGTTQTLGLYVSNMSPTAFSVSSSIVPGSIQTVSTFSVNYIVMG